MHLDGDFRGFEAIKGTTVNNREDMDCKGKPENRALCRWRPQSAPLRRASRPPPAEKRTTNVRITP